MGVLEIAASELGKYQALLRLAEDQVAALDRADYAEFDRIVMRKKVLVDSLVDASRVVASDPHVARMVERIQNCDKAAHRLLFAKLGEIMSDLAAFQRKKSARLVYRSASPTRRQYGPRYAAARLYDRRQ